jgi:branched-subunit amino acid transport protein
MQASPSRAWGVALAVAAGFVAIAVLVLPAFGATWDHVLGEIPHGHLRLEFLRTLDPAWLEIDRLTSLRLPAPHPAVPDQPFSRAVVFSPAAVLSALSCEILHGRLGWLPALEAHHLVAALFAAAALAIATIFIARRLGWLAGIGAAALLATAPPFFSAGITNLKDAPEAALYLAATLAGARALHD